MNDSYHTCTNWKQVKTTQDGGIQITNCLYAVISIIDSIDMKHNKPLNANLVVKCNTE